MENDGIGLMATLPAIVVEEVETIEARPVTDERQVLPDERCNVAVHSVR